MPTRTVQAKVTVTRSETRTYTREELCKRLNVPADAMFSFEDDGTPTGQKLVVEFTRTTERKPKEAK